MPKLLIAVTGSVAAVKIPVLIPLLQPHFEIELIYTAHSTHFFDPTSLPIKSYADEDEWKTWTNMGDPVLHIQLRAWADILLVAPLDANTLAKIANGMCDNLVTCVLRAWDTSKPVVFCPAMNTHMWNHPITASQISTLESWGFTFVPPISKTLACGDTGMGAMAAVDMIVEKVLQASSGVRAAGAQAAE